MTYALHPRDPLHTFTADEDRPLLARVVVRDGRYWASDGHVLASRVAPDVPDTLDDAPQFANIIPIALTCVGILEIPPHSALRHVPSRWLGMVRLGEERMRLTIPARQAKSGKVLCPSVSMGIAQLPETGRVRPRETIGVDAHYLVQCFDFIDAPLVHVHAAGPHDPIIFAHVEVSTRAELLTLPAFSLAMPCRL